jgi:hypothetical protein
MHIELRSTTGELIATAPIIVDADGYLSIEHSTFDFEFDCALYGYQEGGVSTDTIDDMDSGEPLMRWTVKTCANKTAPSCAAVDVYIDQIRGAADCERAQAIAIFEEMCAVDFDFDNVAGFAAQALESEYVCAMRAAMI